MLNIESCYSCDLKVLIFIYTNLSVGSENTSIAHMFNLRFQGALNLPLSIIRSFQSTSWSFLTPERVKFMHLNTSLDLLSKSNAPPSSWNWNSILTFSNNLALIDPESVQLSEVPIRYLIQYYIIAHLFLDPPLLTT